MSSEDSPTARALRTLEVLRARPGVTAAELAQRLGVTERAVRRYVAILREADIPVESVRGPYGGYRLGRGAALPPVSFTETEALSLVMAVLDGGSGTDDRDEVGTALGKVIRALPESVGRQAAVLRAYAAAAPDRHSSRPDPATTSALVEAVAGRCRVLVGYRSESGRHWRTEVDPWAVVVRHGRWYLLCHSHAAVAVRTYRIDRIGSVEPTGTTFVPPPDLDPVTSLEEHLGLGWEFATRVVFEAAYDDVRPWVGAPMGRLQADGPDRCVLVGTTSNPKMYVQEWLAGVPFRFRIEEGPELRWAVEQLLERLMSSLDP